LLLLLLACGKDEDKAAPEATLPADPVLADATLLGMELRDVVDRVMAYRSSHQNRLPGSLRAAGIDSLTSQFVRRLERQGNDPLVTIGFRRIDGRAVSRCRGTNVVLEDLVIRGNFDVACDLTSGGFRSLTITPPAPPAK
jgi:hypothetical protein